MITTDDVLKMAQAIEIMTNIKLPNGYRISSSMTNRALDVLSNMIDCVGKEAKQCAERT